MTHTSHDAMERRIQEFTPLMETLASLYRAAYDAFGKVVISEVDRKQLALASTLHCFSILWQNANTSTLPSEKDLLAMLLKAGEKGQ